jgi:hypothetical protein
MGCCLTRTKESSEIAMEDAFKDNININLSENFKVSTAPPSNMPGFFWPSKETLLAMSAQEVENIRLQTIMCSLDHIIMRLTFVFSNNVESPPQGNYSGATRDAFPI